MNKQSGFSVIELVIALVVIAGLGGAGYVVAHHTNKAKPATTASSNTTSASNTTTGLNYTSPSTGTPVAPQINTSADLNSALQALNQTNVTSSNTDSTQLSSQASGF